MALYPQYTDNLIYKMWHYYPQYTDNFVYKMTLNPSPLLPLCPAGGTSSDPDNVSSDLPDVSSLVFSDPEKIKTKTWYVCNWRKWYNLQPVIRV